MFVRRAFVQPPGCTAQEVGTKQTPTHDSGPWSFNASIPLSQFFVNQDNPFQQFNNKNFVRNKTELVYH